MREIKFRAWDSIIQGFSQFASEYKLCDVNVVHNDKLHFMQYTGLKDKNGVEIYEGDILKGGIYSAYLVEWDKMNTTYNLNEYNCRKEFKVIGNIYQNKDLLEK